MNLELREQEKGHHAGRTKRAQQRLPHIFCGLQPQQQTRRVVEPSNAIIRIECDSGIRERGSRGCVLAEQADQAFLAPLLTPRDS